MCLVKGCSVEVFEVEVGYSYAQRGMRHDCHDALGIVLRLPLLRANAPELRERTAPQDAPSAAAGPSAEHVLWHLQRWLEEGAEKSEAETLTKEFIDKLEPILARVQAADDLEEVATRNGITGDDIVAVARGIAKLYLENLDAQLVGFAPERAAKRRKRRQAGGEAGAASGEKPEAPAASGQGPRRVLTYGVYETMLKYFNDRLDTEGVQETDGQLAKLGKLLFAKRKVSFHTDQWRDTKLDVPMPTATTYPWRG